MRLFCCGITSNEEEKIRDLISKTNNFFDGYVWCVDSNPNSDSTYKLLEDNKKEGKIVRHPWINAHDWQANEWLYSGVFKEGDWIFICDSSETPTEFWLNHFKDDIKYCEDKKIVAIYASGRPYLLKYSEYLYFHNTPHWGLAGLIGNIIQASDEQKQTLIINKRELNPSKHYQEHDTKYYLYGRSNQTEAFYGKYGKYIVENHEILRRKFRSNLKNLGYEVNLKGLKEYFLKGDFTEEMKQIIETEFCLSEFYRREILGEDFMNSIVPRREQWCFLDFIKCGNGFLNYPNYLGTRLKYDKQLSENKNV